VSENIAFAMEVLEKTPEEIKREVPDVLDMVGLRGKENSFPNQLSGGEQQRVAIARALINRPAVLIADEPTGNLDPLNAWEIMNVLERINLNGTTIVMATHNKEIVNRMKKRVIEIDRGQVVRDEVKGGYDNA
jgi:cell division transport system ATP-binding protein